jgi:hypothetical protein
MEWLNNFLLNFSTYQLGWFPKQYGLINGSLTECGCPTPIHIILFSILCLA